MNELFEEKLKVVLNLIRVNNTADEALKITQATNNLVQARNNYVLCSPDPIPQELKQTKKPGASA